MHYNMVAKTYKDILSFINEWTDNIFYIIATLLFCHYQFIQESQLISVHRFKQTH